MIAEFCIGDPPIPVRVWRHARARRIILRLSHTGGAAVLTLPPHASITLARRFAEGHEAWLRQRLAGRPATIVVGHGTSLPFQGSTITVSQGQGRIRHEGAVLHIPGKHAHVGPQVAGYLREAARARLVPAAGHLARRLGCSLGGVMLRDTRSRWGSCTTAGDLMFSWRLIMAPPAVLDYVAAHEVAHLREMNHGPRFWDLVARLDPDFATHRGWLRRHGPELHAYQFRAGTGA